MRTILLINAKGGSGKSTLCTNLASYFASEEKASVVLEDYDPQGSSADWLAVRPDEYPKIIGNNAWEKPTQIPANTDYVIMDSPSGIRGKELQNLVEQAQTLLVPVLPSPMDIRAVAKFIQVILQHTKVAGKHVKVGVIANRVKEYTLIYQQLEKFLNRLDFSFVAKLRDTQNYVRTAERGIGIHEMPPSAVHEDLDQWAPIIKWLKSKRSMP